MAAAGVNSAAASRHKRTAQIPVFALPIHRPAHSRTSPNQRKKPLQLFEQPLKALRLSS